MTEEQKLVIVFSFVVITITMYSEKCGQWCRYLFFIAKFVFVTVSGTSALMRVWSWLMTASHTSE